MIGKFSDFKTNKAKVQSIICIQSSKSMIKCFVIDLIFLVIQLKK